MIVQCEKCGTKYTLDDAKVRPGETKVRCSQCQYVFLVPHPLTLNEEEIFGETEEKADDAFLKEWAKEFSPQSPQGSGRPVSPAPDTGPPPRAFVPPSAEEPLFVQELPPDAAPSPEEEASPFKSIPVEEVPAKKERKVSPTLILILIFFGIVAGAFYWNKMGHSIPAFEYIYEKFYAFMAGQQDQKLFIVFLKGAEYTLEGGKVFAIQGKVANRSQETKRFVKVKGTLFDKAGREVATSIGFCGVTISDEEIKNSTYDALKSSFGFIGAGQAQPVPSQQKLPFTIIFFSPPVGSTDYTVDIVEAGESG